MKFDRWREVFVCERCGVIGGERELRRCSCPSANHTAWPLHVTQIEETNGSGYSEAEIRFRCTSREVRMIPAHDGSDEATSLTRDEALLLANDRDIARRERDRAYEVLGELREALGAPCDVSWDSRVVDSARNLVADLAKARAACKRMREERDALRASRPVLVDPEPSLLRDGAIVVNVHLGGWWHLVTLLPGESKILGGVTFTNSAVAQAPLPPGSFRANDGSIVMFLGVAKREIAEGSVVSLGDLNLSGGVFAREARSSPSLRASAPGRIYALPDEVGMHAESDLYAHDEAIAKELWPGQFQSLIKKRERSYVGMFPPTLPDAIRLGSYCYDTKVTADRVVDHPCPVCAQGSWLLEFDPPGYRCATCGLRVRVLAKNEVLALALANACASALAREWKAKKTEELAYLTDGAADEARLRAMCEKVGRLGAQAGAAHEQAVTNAILETCDTAPPPKNPCTRCGLEGAHRTNLAGWLCKEHAREYAYGGAPAPAGDESARRGVLSCWVRYRAGMPSSTPGVWARRLGWATAVLATAACAAAALRPDVVEAIAALIPK